MNIARTRLTRKLLLVFLLPTAVCLLLFAVVTAELWHRSWMNDADRDLEEHVALIATFIEPIRAQNNLAEVRRVLEELVEIEKIHGVAVYDKEGHPIARSSVFERSPQRVDAIADRVRATGLPHQAVEVFGSEEALVRAEKTDGIHIGAIVVTHTLRPLKDFLVAGLVSLALPGIGLVAVYTGIAIALARVLGRGLGSLIDAASHVKEGDLEVRVQASRFVELDTVADSFNDMVQSLHTAREELERALVERREMQRRILRAQPLAVVGQVSASFAHEIGSPLNTILGWARLAATDLDAPEAIRKQSQIIVAQCERITRIVERMLSVARPSSPTTEATDVTETLREVIQFVSPDARARRIDIRLAAPANLPRVKVPRDSMVQVALNLLMNAMQAQPQGGQVRVSVAMQPSDAHHPDYLVVEVADAGPGIAETEREKVFEPFYTTKKSEGGTGLGLPIVWEIIREAGGRVFIDQAPEGGALVRVSLPV